MKIEHGTLTILSQLSWQCKLQPASSRKKVRQFSPYTTFHYNVHPGGTQSQSDGDDDQNIFLGSTFHDFGPFKASIFLGGGGGGGGRGGARSKLGIISTLTCSYFSTCPFMGMVCINF